MAQASLTNSFTNSQWYNINNPKDLLIDIVEVDTFVGLDFSNEHWEVTSNYNNFLNDNGAISVNSNFGLYLLNISFNSTRWNNNTGI